MLLADQDRSALDRAAIAEGLGLTGALGAARARPLRDPGGDRGRARPRTRAEDTDWVAIAGAYQRLAELDDSPVVALNRAVAVAMAHGPEAGLALADEQAEALDGYHLLHATRADLLRRLGRTGEAAEAYSRAVALAGNPVERAFLAGRLEEVRSP